MSSKIVPLLPRHTVYCEPFAGGAAIFFAKPWPPATNTNHYCEVLNDQNQELMNLYQVVRTPGLREQFVERLQLTPYARIEHRAAVISVGVNVRPAENPNQDYYDGLDPLVARAVAHYVNLQCSFAKKLNGGWGTGVFGRNSGATWVNKIASLPEYLTRMQGVHIECDDALSVIKRWDSPQTLFYCDPPYPETRQSYHERGATKGAWTHDNNKALFRLAEQSQGSFVISGYPHDYADPSWERFDFKARSSAQGSSRGSKKASEGHTRTGKGTRANTDRTECVWRIDRSDTAREEVQKIWKKWGWKKGDPMPSKNT